MRTLHTSGVVASLVVTLIAPPALGGSPVPEDGDGLAALHRRDAPLPPSPSGQDASPAPPCVAGIDASTLPLVAGRPDAGAHALFVSGPPDALFSVLAGVDGRPEGVVVHGELRSDGEALVALPSVGREGGAPPELFLWLEAADAKPMVALITSLSETVTTLHGRDVRARFHPTEGSALDGFVTFDAGPERAATAFIDRAEPHAGGVLFSLPEIPSSSTAAVTMVLTKSVEGSFALPENDMVWPSAPEGALPCDDPSIATSAVDKKCAIVTAACITIFAMIYQGCLQKCGSSPDPDGCKNDCDTAWGIKKWGLCGLIFYACKVLDRLGVGGDALHDGGVSSDEEAQSAPVLTTG